MEEEKFAPRIAYICKVESNAECDKTWCHINNGSCYHTTDIKYAKNFEHLTYPGCQEECFMERMDEDD